MSLAPSKPEREQWRENAEEHGQMAKWAIEEGADVYWVWICAWRAFHAAGKVLDMA